MPLNWLQYFLISTTLILSALSAPRLLVYIASLQANIPLEFRGVMLSLSDFSVGALLLVTILRLGINSAYRERLSRFIGPLVQGNGKWWLLLVLWLAVGLFYALDGVMLRFAVLHLGLMVVLAAILADLFHNEPASRRIILIVMVFSGMSQAVIALLQALNRNPLGWWALGEIERFSYDTNSFYRAPGLTTHPNYLGGYLLVALAATCVLAMIYWHSRWRIPLVSAGIVLLAGMVTTLSRSAALGLLVAVLFLIFTQWKNLPARQRRLVMLSFGSVLLMGGILALIFLAVDPANIFRRTLAPREFFFEQSWPVIQDHPWLGVGAGNLMLAVGPREGLELVDLLPIHNVYLYIWGESGLPGMLLFIIAAFSLLRRPNVIVPYALYFKAAFIGVLVISLFDNYFWAIHPFRVYFFCLLGLCWATTQPTAASNPPSVSLDSDPVPSV
jgi:O-antigen ligase